MKQLTIGRFLRFTDEDMHVELSGIIEFEGTVKEAQTLLHTTDMGDPSTLPLTFLEIADIGTAHYNARTQDSMRYYHCMEDSDIAEMPISSIGVMSKRIQTSSFNGFLFMDIYSEEEWQRREIRKASWRTKAEDEKPLTFAESVKLVSAIDPHPNQDYHVTIGTMSNDGESTDVRFSLKRHHKESAMLCVVEFMKEDDPEELNPWTLVRDEEDRIMWTRVNLVDDTTEYINVELK